MAEALPGGPLVATLHTGPCDDLATTCTGLSPWFAEQGLTASDATWEESLVGPESTPEPSRWQARIVYPVA